MSRSSLRVDIIVAFLGISLTVGCAQSDFAGGANKKSTTASRKVSKKTGQDANGSDAKPTDDEAHQSEDRGDSIIETFDLDRKQGSLDLVWVVDNSGSMLNKIAMVRQRFDDFMNRVSQRTDLRIILISMPEGSNLHPDRDVDLGLSLTASQQSAGHVQIPIEVGSYNLLAMAAAASCQASATSVSGSHAVNICGRPASETRPAPGKALGLESPENVTAVAGKLLPYFRPGAVRSYVFVSDENSGYFSADDFVSVIRSNHGSGVLPHVFAFRGDKAVTHPGCTSFVSGVDYDQVITQLGGAAFDICLPDWGTPFSQLTDSLVSAVRTNFALTATQFSGIESVKVDGHEIGSADYSLEGNVVTLKSPAIPADARQLVISLKK